MPLGTPADYEYAVAAEWDGVELEHGPHRKHDYHAFLDEICRQAAELSGLRDANPGLSDRLDRIDRRAERRQDIAERLLGLAADGGLMVIRGIAFMSGFNLSRQEVQRMLGENPATD